MLVVTDGSVLMAGIVFLFEGLAAEAAELVTMTVLRRAANNNANDAGPRAKSLGKPCAAVKISTLDRVSFGCLPGRGLFFESDS